MLSARFCRSEAKNLSPPRAQRLQRRNLDKTQKTIIIEKLILFIIFDFTYSLRSPQALR